MIAKCRTILLFKSHARFHIKEGRCSFTDQFELRISNLGIAMSRRLSKLAMLASLVFNDCVRRFKSHKMSRHVS